MTDSKDSKNGLGNWTEFVLASAVSLLAVVVLCWLSTSIRGTAL